LLCVWQYQGGAIYVNRGTADITGSKFEGNTATIGGNNIFGFFGEVTCDDDTNTFESPAGGVTQDNDSEGNYPANLCVMGAINPYQ
jgi:hypothetical protein